ncbi:succinate dehydrogenase iron-sulfur subunit [Vibrio sp. HA2012]|uniref:succinate dehydrogenase iron-sulfur subunit n=1 Tax=Vibrio sp. HA2012 TaxID=1971595 RepID=UPI000C2CB2F7|nr:succinate dehydrogenase iron-sulfur subunit [Vibrio sp. HA2012]PJC85526.1 succinate dehydrogenase iron-sulfur subunit [Vibrio sp. HA2012]
MQWHFWVYRYNPDLNPEPYMQAYQLQIGEDTDMMLLDALLLLKEQDPTLSFRHACRDGSCGSDGLNINGINRLACMTPLSELNWRKKIVIRPLPGLPVIRDLVVDLQQIYKNYAKVKPYLHGDTEPVPGREFIQSVEERGRLDGLFECNICGCCSTACPSFLWHPDKFIGPAGLLAAYRWLNDSRDCATEERLSNLEDAFSVFRCHAVMNCVSVCPKGLNPAKAIGNIKLLLLKRTI